MTAIDEKMMKPNLKGRHLLVLDEDQALREFYSFILSAKGFVVLSAATRDEAFQLLADERITPLVAIVDISRKNDSGWTFVHDLHDQNPETPLPLLGIIEAGEDAGWETFKKLLSATIVKGEFDISQFLELTTWLARRRIQRECARQHMYDKTQIC